MSNPDEIERIANELLDRGLDDWVHLPEAWYVAKSVGASRNDHETRQLVIEAIRLNLDRGLVQVGEVTAETGFRPWRGFSAEVMAQLEEAWPGGSPDLTGEGWIANTPEGDRIAKDRLGRDLPNAP